MNRIIILALFLPAFLASCLETRKQGLKDGLWRAELTVHEKKVPVLLEVTSGDTDNPTLYLINGEERVELTGISYRADSIEIPINAYDAVIRGYYNESLIEGRFIRNFIDQDPGIPFSAEWGNTLRFAESSSPASADPEGKWDLLFISDSGDTIKNVGIFSSQGQTVSGSVLTSTGDLRYLEGAVTDSGFQLSAFSGLSPYLIEVQFSGDNEFTGFLYTSRSKTRLHGLRNDGASLPDPYSLTWLKEGYDRIGFSFPNLKGQMISPEDDAYQGKVVIISILGSWCPNCLDEMEFLVPWYRENHHRGVEIIGLAFERKDDPGYVSKVLSNLINRYNIPFEILFAGTTGAESTAKALPAINRIASYPTTIFIDKKGLVRKIHTGFNGPATGIYFEEFKRDFNRFMDQLLAE
jgi:thiol-disulfide isomerase/thioredoxin